MLLYLWYISKRIDDLEIIGTIPINFICKWTFLDLFLNIKIMACKNRIWFSDIFIPSLQQFSFCSREYCYWRVSQQHLQSFDSSLFSCYSMFQLTRIRELSMFAHYNHLIHTTIYNHIRVYNHTVCQMNIQDLFHFI